jgi:hypothetical protein
MVLTNAVRIAKKKNPQIDAPLSFCMLMLSVMSSQSLERRSQRSLMKAVAQKVEEAPREEMRRVGGWVGGGGWPPDPKCNVQLVGFFFCTCSQDCALKGLSASKSARLFNV